MIPEQARPLVEELLDRIPTYELVGEPRWQRSTWARAYGAVPILFPTPQVSRG